MKEDQKIEEPPQENIKEKVPDLCIEVDEDISLWRAPLLPNKSTGSTNVVLLKFLRAKSLRWNEAFEMEEKDED